MKMPTQVRSIAFRLIVAVLAVELLSALLVVFLSFGYERHIHFRAFDVALRGRIDSVLGAVQDADDAEDNVMLNQADLHLPPDDIYEVYDANGRLLGRSANWQGNKTLFESSNDIFLRLAVNGEHYRAMLFHGSRIVDPGEPGGGKLRRVTVLYGAKTEHVWRAINGAVEFYAIGNLVLLLVTGPLIAWLLHRGLLPLRQLATLAAGVSVDSWDFEPPASAHKTPELAPLTQAVENVLQRLERSFVQQRAFVSDAAHELKTAVAVIKSSLQLMGMRRRTPEEYQAGLERCLADALRLEEIVAKMLTLARVESGGAAAGPAAQCDLGASVRRAVAELETFAELRQVRVSVAAPAGATVAMAAEDCGLLLSNLLMNALQHSPSGSAVNICIALQLQAHSVELQIEDHGDGIPPEALPNIFDRFYRGDPSRTRSTGGTGLGLAIVKAIVNRAGGSVSIASQPAQGTTVTVQLPLAAEPAAT